MAVKKVVKKRKEFKNVDKGQVHIKSSFNNTIITITDANGNTITQCSSGALGYRGSRKSTPFAAQQASETAAKVAMEHGLRSILHTAGLGMGKGLGTCFRRFEGISTFHFVLVHLALLLTDRSGILQL